MSQKVPQKNSASAEPRPFVGVAVLLWKDDYLLLGQRIDASGEHSWQFPGGHLEVGEKVLECAAREVREETGLAISFAEHAAFSDEMFSMGGRDYVTLYVTAACLSGEPELMEPDKCRCWQWFLYDQLPAPLFLPVSQLLKQVPDLSVFQVAPASQAGGQK
ncbi:MAG: NUDIX domain-containing protein [Gammaproteobacteria bacterium]|nr:NUDIX domain-containing protein [Gammaproteobacteria bacterium]